MGNAIRLRELRNRVRFISSLLSGRGRVTERMSDLWACAPVERIIFWRETLPYPPFGNTSDKDLMFLIGHEAGHLNFTGGWDEPEDWTREKSEAFKHFQNFIEDIRIERLMGVDFSGFEKVRPECRQTCLTNMWEEIPVKDMPLYQQCGGYWYFKDVNDPDFLSKKLKKFCEEVWPEVDRVSNARSTKDLSDAIIPLFEKLWKEDPRNGGGGENKLDSNEFSGMGDGFGDKPSDNPSKSPMGSGQKPMSFEEMIDGIARSMKTEEGRKAIARIKAQAKQAQDKADYDMKTAVGPHPGDEAGIPPSSDNSWDIAKRTVQPQINMLSHRLRTVLKTNSMGNWQEGRRRGKMNTHRAMRAVAGNNRIFRQRTILGARDYTWGITIDVSGSMGEHTRTKDGGYGGSKAENALKATVLLAESFEKADMPCFVIPWETTLRDRKKITEKIKRKKNQLGADIHYPSGGTYEAPVLIASQEEFARIPSGHRVLFVISDGATSGVDESQQIITELESMGVVVIGVGVGIPAPLHYAKRVSVNDASELVDLLPRLVNEFVRKGGGV